MWSLLHVTVTSSLVVVVAPRTGLKAFLCWYIYFFVGINYFVHEKTNACFIKLIYFVYLV